MFAQTLKVEAPNVVAADEQFNVTFIIEGENEPGEFEWSPGNDFRLVWGPQQGRSTNITIVGGKRTRSSQFTYTYVLMPRTLGTFQLPQARVKVKGKELVAPQISIEVVSDGSSSNAQAGNSGNSGQAPRSAGEISNEDLFLKFTLDRTDVVIGEPITATLKLYQRVNIVGFEDARFPSFNGFWSQEIETPVNIEFKRESYNDKIYNTAVIRKYMLIPQQAGTINIDPAELVCLVNIRVASGGGASIFDGFFDDYRTIRKRVVSSSYKVHVSPLPSGAPASFGGGVGRFSISAKLSTDSLKTHEAASLIVTVSGKGNVSLLEAPKVTFPPDVEVYDTKISEKIDKSSGGTSGSKIYEFPFIPRSHGDFVIPSVKYAYYDIAARKYVTLETGPLDFKVARGNETDSSFSSPVVPGVNRKGVKSLNEDIRFIQTRMPKLVSEGRFFVCSSLFWLLAAMILVTAVVLWAALRKLAARKADIAGTRTRKATKMALKRLKLAGDFLKKDLYTAFYEELHKAVLGYVSDKLNVSVAELSKERIYDSLLAGGVDKSLADAFVGILDACEFARYSPDAGHEAMANHYDEAIRVISSIDSSMKKRKKKSGAALAVVLVMILSVPASVYAAPAVQNYTDSLWTAASGAYTEGNWEKAISAYSSICSTGMVSASLYCNLGNAFFKNSDYPRAILNYERALKLDPSYEDAKYNLTIASSMIQDKIDQVPEFILKRWLRELCYTLDSDTWAVICLVLACLFAGMLLLFLLAPRPGGRKAGFFCALAALLLTCAAFSFSLWQRNDYRRANTAIVMSPVSSVKSSPSAESSKDLFILHEGTKVKVLDEVGRWNNIELADGRRGWVSSDEIEII